LTTTAPPYPAGRDLLAGKTVLVTAAAGTGIGFAAARRCAEEGARLVISDIHERRLEAAAAEIEKLGGARPATRVCNVTKEDEVRALVAGAIDALGHIDVLVNNAGLGGFAPLVEMTMLGRGSGSIVNNASVLGWRAQAGQAHYAAAKAGVMALTRCAAVEAAEAGVRVNAVAPSLAMHEFLSKVTPPGLLAELTAREAFGRAAEPWEVANVIVFLASDLSSYMTGEVVAVSSQHP
jgi:3-oxoacyl-[acyl-carrier protein] reductase